MTERPEAPSSAKDARPQTGLDEAVAHAQHQLSNPLAAALAELQLLQMESTLATEHREAVDRITQLVRRVIALVRDLDQELLARD